MGFLVIVALLVGHAIHDGHKGRGNPFVWLFGRISFSGILYFHPYYQVTSPEAPMGCLSGLKCAMHSTPSEELAVENGRHMHPVLPERLSAGMVCILCSTTGNESMRKALPFWGDSSFWV